MISVSMRHLLIVICRFMPCFKNYSTLLKLGLPITAGMLSQSLLNLVDAAMVGQLGEIALAGVGAAGYSHFVVISLILGLSSSVQVKVARLMGNRSTNRMISPVNAAILISILISLPLSAFVIPLSEYILAIVIDTQSPQGIIAEQYFDYRASAIVFVAINLSLRGWWNGTHRPITYIKALFLTQLLNVFFSYILIFGHLGLPAYGAAGAGLGTALAMVSCVGINIYLIFRDPTAQGFLRYWPSFAMIRQILSASIPHSLQQLFMAFAILILFSIVARLGVSQQAIAHVLINFALLLILPAVGIGMASTSLISHAIGSRDHQAAYLWGWRACYTATFLLFTISLPIWAFPEAILQIFLTDPTLISQATLPLQLTAVAICVDVAAIVLAQALLGANATKQVFTITTSVQWIIFLPLAWLAGPLLGFGLLGIWLAQIFYRALASIIFIYIWKQQGWLTIHR